MSFQFSDDVLLKKENEALSFCSLWHADCTHNEFSQSSVLHSLCYKLHCLFGILMDANKCFANKPFLTNRKIKLPLVSGCVIVIPSNFKMIMSQRGWYTQVFMLVIHLYNKHSSEYVWE